MCACEDTVVISIIPERFSFCPLPDNYVRSLSVSYLSFDDYPEFDQETLNPLPLDQIHRFISLINQMLDTEANPIICCCKRATASVTNAVLVMSAFCMTELGQDAKTAIQPFHAFHSLIRSYRESLPHVSAYELSVRSCLDGLKRASDLNWYNPREFEAGRWKHETDEMEEVWVVPDKLLEFRCRAFDSGRVCERMKEQGVACIVVLCGAEYDDDCDDEIRMVRTAFENDRLPPRPVVREFMDMMEKDEKVALHDDPVSSRGATLAALYLVKKCGFDAHEAISWLSLCSLTEDKLREMNWSAEVQSAEASMSFRKVPSETKPTTIQRRRMHSDTGMTKGRRQDGDLLGALLGTRQGLHIPVVDEPKPKRQKRSSGRPMRPIPLPAHAAESDPNLPETYRI